MKQLSNLTALNVEAESPFGQTWQSAILLLVVTLMAAPIAQVFINLNVWQIVYLLPLIMLMFGCGFNVQKLLDVLIKKYPVKYISEKALFAILLVLVLFKDRWIQFVPFEVPLGTAFRPDNYFFGQLFYSGVLGLALCGFFAIILKKAIFYEDEKIIEHLLKAYHFSGGFFVVPLFSAILLYGGILMPVANYQATHNILVSTVFSLLGFSIAMLLLLLDPFVLWHMRSFLFIRNWFDTVRIVRYLFNSKYANRNKLINTIENKDKLDRYLSLLLKAGTIERTGELYQLSNKAVFTSDDNLNRK